MRFRVDSASGSRLARALVKRPRVLLLDEPLAALDKKLREQMQLELKRLQSELAITFVVVTHDQDEALVMADRIGVMSEGRIVQLDTPWSLYERPATRFVAEFIGTSNFLEGHMVDGGLAVSGLGVFEACGEVPIGAKGILALRPERVQLCATTSRPPGNALAGTVADIAYHGQDMSIHVAVPSMKRPLLARVSAADDNATGLGKGQPVWCAWRAEHGRLLAE